jgi:hypothetical protein
MVIAWFIHRYMNYTQNYGVYSILRSRQGEMIVLEFKSHAINHIHSEIIPRA